MSGRATVSVESIQRSAQAVTVHYVYKDDDGRVTPWRVDLPDWVKISPEECCNSALFWMCLGAMMHGKDLHVNGPVSADLMRTMPMFLEYYQRARPYKYPRVIEIDADCSYEDTPPQGNPMLMCFSGGVDSSYSLYKNRIKENKHPLDIAACLNVRGYGIPYTDMASHERLIAKISPALKDASVPLMTAATDVPNFLANEGTGLRLSAVMSLFRNHFRAGVIACDCGYDDVAMHIWGNGWMWPFEIQKVPITIDWFGTNMLLTTNQFPIVNEGFDRSRRDKCREIKNWPIIEETLQICWHGDRTTNCGKCDKCMTTQMAFLSCDITPPKALGMPNNQFLARHRPDDGDVILFHCWLDLARREGIDTPWTRRMAKILRRWRTQYKDFNFRYV